MFGAYRLEVIREILNEKKYIDVISLSEILGVSEVTVRRDLNKLEEQGFIVRSHGGAYLKENGALPESLPECAPESSSQGKPIRFQAIGEIAATHVPDGSTIFIGAGAECQAMARHLTEKKELTVVTNDLNVCSILAGTESVQLILAGGFYDPKRNLTGGDMVLQVFHNIFVQKAFVSVDGAHLTRGYTTSDYYNQSLMQHLSRFSDELYLLFSSEKVAATAPYRIGDLSFAPNVITDANLDKAYQEYFYQNNIKLFMSLD